MQYSMISKVPGLLLMLLVSANTSATAANDCREEALSYGIAAELLDDYVIGCMESSGESSSDYITGLENLPAVDMENTQDEVSDMNSADPNSLPY